MVVVVEVMHLQIEQVKVEDPAAVAELEVVAQEVETVLL